jgi:hypothetical protein
LRARHEILNPPRLVFGNNSWPLRVNIIFAVD